MKLSNTYSNQQTTKTLINKLFIEQGNPET